MAFPISLLEEEWSAVVAMAREGTKDAEGQVIPERARRLEKYLHYIEEKNGITRSCLWVQWQEMDQPLPPNTRFPTTWPPELRQYIELTTRAVARVDVEAVLTNKARRPTNVLVTTDPDGVTGWSTLDAFFIT